MKQVLRTLLVTFLLSLFIAGLAQGVLRLASTEDWETLDPAFASGVNTGAMVAKLYDGLMRYDYDAVEVVPNLAEDFEVNEDSTEFTFTLKEGVTFHDGSPLTANDVKYSVERVLNPDTASPVSWVFGDTTLEGAQAFIDGEAEAVSGVEVVDERTVRFTLDQPYALFLNHLAMPAAHVVLSEERVSLRGQTSPQIRSAPALSRLPTGPGTRASPLKRLKTTTTAHQPWSASSTASSLIP